MNNKKIQIFLGVLIVIGLGLIATQKFWVPSLVNQIIKMENKNKVTNEIPEISNLSDDQQNWLGEFCFEYNQIATESAPYSSNEILKITLNETNVTGVKSGTQSGPDMNNGFSGTINGVTENQFISVVYDYVVEGSNGQEVEIYQKSGLDLIKKRYELMLDDQGILVPDFTKPVSDLLYRRIDC